MKKTATLLGPSPCWTGLLFWAASALFACCAWWIYTLFPFWGLIVIGLTPFVCLFLFFRGLGRFSRAFNHLLTVLRARRLGLHPDWGSTCGGFLLIDETRGFWVANGKSGSLDEISRIRCHDDGHTYLLEAFVPDQDNPVFSLGVDGKSSLQTTGIHLKESACAFSGKEVLLEQKCDEDE